MNRVQEWLQLWRIESVELSSPLSLQEAEQRLAAEFTRPRARSRTRPANPDGRLVVGRMRRAHRIRAYGARVGWENSFVPLLDAHLVSEDDGCRLSGTLGWAPWVRVQSAGGIVFAVLWTLGAAVGLAMGAHGPFLPFLAIGGAMTALGVCLPGWAGRAGWRDAAFLLDWLHERLQVPGHLTGVGSNAVSGRSVRAVPYTPRPQSPYGWARLGVQAVAIAGFLVGVTNLGSHRPWAIPLIVIAVCANAAMFWLNHRAARRHHESLG